jgi:hypothetical protein
MAHSQAKARKYEHVHSNLHYRKVFVTALKVTDLFGT